MDSEKSINSFQIKEEEVTWLFMGLFYGQFVVYFIADFFQVFVISRNIEILFVSNLSWDCIRQAFFEEIGYFSLSTVFEKTKRKTQKNKLVGADNFNTFNASFLDIGLKWLTSVFSNLVLRTKFPSFSRNSMFLGISGVGANLGGYW